MTAETSLTGRAYKLFFDAVLHGRVDELTQALYSVLGFPVQVIDKVGKLVCMVPDIEQDDEGWKKMHRDKTMDFDHYRAVQRHFADSEDVCNKPFVLEGAEGGQGTSRQVVGIIALQGRPLGFCTILLGTADMTEEGMQVAEIFMQALSHMLADDAYLDPADEHLSACLNDILWKRDVDPVGYRESLQHLGAVLGSARAILVMQPRDADDSAMPEHLVATIAEECRGCIATVYKNRAVVLLGEELRERRRVGVKATADQVKEHIIDIARAHECRVSESQAFDSLDQVRDAYLRAALTLEVGLRRSSDEMVFRYQDFHPQQIFCCATDALPLRCLLSDKGIAIYEYDRAHGTEYMALLSALFRNMLNRAQAASSLYIHPNTFAYRLGKIEELFDVDMKDVKDVWSLACDLAVLDAHSAR